jgi:23S rRNA pseudouridine1911/1915/1917 synthase
MTEWTVGPAEAGGRLDKFLAAPERLGSRGRAVAALERGKIFVNGAETTESDAARRLNTGDAVRVWMDRPGSAKTRQRRPGPGDLAILFEDSEVIVVNKPPGLLSVPLERKAEEPSVYDRLQDHFRSRGKRKPFVVHRIDRDTSGLVVFAKHPGSQTRLKEQFKRRTPDRVYWAVVLGHPSPPQGTWRDRLVWDDKARIQKEARARDPNASEAITEYRVVETFSDASLVEFRLRTGRRNQIRIQAALHGHSLVGERRYLHDPDAPPIVPFERQALHAYRLAFDHPVDGRRVEFEAPLPADFLSLVERLRRRRLQHLEKGRQQG